MFTDGLDVVGSCSAQALVDYTTVLHVISFNIVGYVMLHGSVNNVSAV